MMRKGFSIIIYVLIITTLFAGCSKKKNESEPVNSIKPIGQITDIESFKSEISNRINLSKYGKPYITDTECAYSNYTIGKYKDDLGIILDGKEIPFPTKIGDFFDITGWSSKNSTYPANVEKRSYLYANDALGHNTSLYLLNLNNEPVDCKNAYFAGFEVNYYNQMKNGLETEKLPSFNLCGITQDSTLDEVVATLGRPYRVEYSQRNELEYVFLEYAFKTKNLFDYTKSTNIRMAFYFCTNPDFLSDGVNSYLYDFEFEIGAIF